MAHIRTLFTLLLAGSETLVVQWLLLLTTGAGLSWPAALACLLGFAALNVLAMATLFRFARTTRLAFVGARVWMLGSLGAVFSGPLLAGSFTFVGGTAWLTRDLGGEISAMGHTALIASGGLAVAVGFGSILWGYLVGARRVDVERVELPMRRLPAALSGIRIAHITDLHIGPQLRAPQLADLVRQVNRLQAELIVITGDIFDFDPKFIEEGCIELSKLSAAHGVFAVLGNHDTYTGSDAVADGLERFTQIRLLRDEWVELPIEGAGLVIAGLEDDGVGWRDKECESPVLERLAAEIPSDKPRILLIHRPSYFGQASRLRFPVSLAGHTHGGQISPPPPAHHANISRLISHWTRGLFWDDAEECLLYVSRGIGIAGPPVRLNCSREIALLRLIERR